MTRASSRVGESTSPLPRMPGIASSHTPLRSGLAAGSAVFPVACVEKQRPAGFGRIPSAPDQTRGGLQPRPASASADSAHWQCVFGLLVFHRGRRRSLELEDALARQRAYAWDGGRVGEGAASSAVVGVAWRGAPSSIGLSPSVESESNSSFALVARLVATIETAARGWVARARLRGATRWPAVPSDRRVSMSENSTNARRIGDPIHFHKFLTLPLT